MVPSFIFKLTQYFTFRVALRLNVYTHKNWFTVILISTKEMYIHYENTPIQIHVYRIFYHQKKNENFQIKNSDIFLISAQNTVCGYSLEPPR